MRFWAWHEGNATQLDNGNGSSHICYPFPRNAPRSDSRITHAVISKIRRPCKKKKKKKKKMKKKKRKSVKWNEWQFQTVMWQYSISVFSKIPADQLSQTCSRALIQKSLGTWKQRYSISWTGWLAGEESSTSDLLLRRLFLKYRRASDNKIPARRVTKTPSTPSTAWRREADSTGKERSHHKWPPEFSERSQISTSLRHYLRAQSQGHRAIDRMEEEDGIWQSAEKRTGQSDRNLRNISNSSCTQC